MGDIWAKFNKNERNVSFGAAIVLIAWVLGAIGSYGFGIGILTALGAIVVLVIYYLKYAPNQNIQWPAPISTIVLAISGIIAIVAVLNLISILGLLSLAGFFGIYLVALLAVTAGALLMAFGAWQEYQASAADRAATSSGTPVAPSSAAGPPASTGPTATDSGPVDAGDGTPVV